MSTVPQLNWHNKYQETVAELHQMRGQLDSLQAQRDALLQLAEGQARKLDAIEQWAKGLPK